MEYVIVKRNTGVTDVYGHLVPLIQLTAPLPAGPNIPFL